jgi:hypothetical protein
VSTKKIGKETLCRVSKIKYSAKSFFAECFLLPRIFLRGTRQKASLSSDRKKHSAKYLTLGKEPNSGSVAHYINFSDTHGSDSVHKKTSIIIVYGNDYNN